PDAPVAIAATGLASTGFTANWNASNGATSYRLDVSMSDTFASFVTGYQDLTVNGLSQTVSGLAPLSVYFYRVRAFNAAGTSFNSNPIMVQTTEAASTILTEGFEGSTTAAPPVGWTLSSPGSYILSNVANAHGGTCYGGLNALNGWISTPQLDNPTEMTFWCRASGTTSNFTISIQNSANGTDYTDVTTFVANGTDTGSITSTYTQKSVSLNLTGSNYLRWFVSVRTGGSFYFDDVVVNGGSVTPVLPSIPVASDASSITATSFTANWIASTNASYYRLDVSTSSSFNSFVTGFNDLVVTGLSQAVTALDPETFYYYRVRAANTVGTSDNSNIVQVYTTSNPVIPNAPVATQATSISAITFTANWNAVTTATGYRLDVSASPTFGSYISGYQDLAVDGVSQVVTGLSALSTYYYRVRAVNNAGTSTNSNSISVTTTNTDPYNGYYNPVVGLTGNALKTGLTNLISTNTYSSYDGAKLIMFQQLDNHNGVVRCVYTGQDFSIAPDYNGSSSPNTEHTYAQSWFTGPASVEKADLHHLFVTESTVNSSRGNLPFGKVITTATTYASYNGYVSKRGTDFNSQTVFEPADQHKGDCARALLYFNVRYGESLTIGGVDQLPACIQWNYLDPPNADEIARNTLIQATLTNRNPFVDHPEYVTSIYVGTTSNTMLNFDPTVSSVSENVGTVHLSVQIQNPNVYASTATVVLKSGNPAHIGNFTPVTVTFPMNSATPQIVDINVTDDDIVDGNETFVFEIQNAQGGYYAIPGLANDYTLTVEDNETGIQVPIALPAVQMGNTAFLAHWVAPNGITSFALDVAHDNGFTNFLSGFNNLIVNDTTYSVTGLVEGQTYYYRVRSILNDVQSTNSNVITIILTGNQDHVVNSLRAGIESVYPNPFNPETTIKYNVTKPGDVSIVIYNVKGQKVRTLVADHLNSGSYTVKWDGNNDKGQSCSSSVYYLKMQEGNKISLKKIVLMK
ncbi:MAG TPA: endonuclease, partial [Candidatus Cloacimonadota bacterium]|nr:endonuclease [Candidatus Cloacimonadota bacterium]